MKGQSRGGTGKTVRKTAGYSSSETLKRERDSGMAGATNKPRPCRLQAAADREIRHGTIIGRYQRTVLPCRLSCTCTDTYAPDSGRALRSLITRESASPETTLEDQREQRARVFNSSLSGNSAADSCAKRTPCRESSVFREKSRKSLKTDTVYTRDIR